MTTPANPLAGRNFRDETGAPVVPGHKLGEGGEGVVHLVEGDPGSVMKIWHPGRVPQDAHAKIRHLVNNPVQPELGAAWHITWPRRMVMENGAIAGYTMPLLNPGESWEPVVEYYNRRAAQGTGAAQGRELRIDDRVRMARNLALGFRAVHDAGYVIGDVNEKNVEVNRQNDIAMVDCDSYGFTDPATGRTFANNLGRPEFQAPEVQGDYANRTQDHDLFGLAVVIFHLLTGYHPYTVTNQPNHALPGERISAWLFAPASGGRVTAPAPFNEAWDALTDGRRSCSCAVSTGPARGPAPAHARRVAGSPAGNAGGANAAQPATHATTRAAAHTAAPPAAGAQPTAANDRRSHPPHRSRWKCGSTGRSRWPAAGH